MGGSEREGEREPQAGSALSAGARCGAWTHELWDLDLSQNQESSA